jgi:lipopolysaccharide transport system permease protein
VSLRAAARSLPNELLLNLTLRELRSKFKRSALGWLWSVINPLTAIVVYSFVFGIFFKAEPPVGDPSGLHSYAFFLVCGLLPWTFLSNGLGGATGSIVANEGLVKKVFFPRWVLPAASTLSWVATFGVELLVLGVVLGLFGNVVLVWVPLVLVVVLVQFVFVLGVGLALSALNTYFRDIQHFLSILLNVWFYATPVIYPIDLPPERAEVLGVDVPVRAIIDANPMTAFVDAYRALLYDLRAPSAATLLEIVAWAAVAAAVGTLVFRRLEPRLAEEL